MKDIQWQFCVAQVDDNHTGLLPREGNSYVGVAIAKGGVGFQSLFLVGHEQKAFASQPEMWPLRSQTKNMFPFRASVHVWFAVFNLPCLRPFQDDLSRQKGVDSQGKPRNLQFEQNK